MKWSIRKEVDGVITDDPKKFLDVCDRWEGGEQEVRLSWTQVFELLRINLYVVVFGLLFWWKFGEAIDRRWVKRPVLRPR